MVGMVAARQPLAEQEAGPLSALVHLVARWQPPRAAKADVAPIGDGTGLG